MIINKRRSLQHKKNFEKYNAAKAHEEMVIKSGGGINNLLDELEYKNYQIEVLTQNIARLNYEINNMEKKIIQLGICYKFQNSFIIIEINKELFKNKFKKFKKIICILNLIQYIKIKNIIILLNLLFFLQQLKLF